MKYLKRQKQKTLLLLKIYITKDIKNGKNIACGTLYAERSIVQVYLTCPNQSNS